MIKPASSPGAQATFKWRVAQYKRSSHVDLFEPFPLSGVLSRKGNNMKKIVLVLMGTLASLSSVNAAAPPTGCIGIAVELTPAGTVLIDKVLDGTPAQGAGLQPGDIVEAVQPLPGSAMVSLQGKTLEDAVNLMRGTVGTEETVLVKRGDGEFSVSMVREPINNS
jgi:predicted metalloprotease with PDZ domain